jgi:hypothetical protein
MRDFGKVHTSFWTSSTVRDMSEDGRSMAIYLLTSPHGTIAGVFRLPDGYACDDLQWDSTRVQSAFAELQQRGFARRCEATKWVWIINHFEWNPLENPNQKKAAAKVANMIPATCAWGGEFFVACGQLFRLEGGGQRNPSGTVPQTLLEPFRNQEQEQEQEQYQEQEATTTSAPEPQIDQPHPSCDQPAAPPASASDVHVCPVGSLVDMYHECMPMNPQVKVLNDARKKAIRARWKEAALLEAKPFGYTTRDEGLTAWRVFFTVCAESAFLTDRAPSAPGKPPFVADIDFIFSPSGFAKTLENKYHRDAA